MESGLTNAASSGSTPASAHHSTGSMLPDGSSNARSIANPSSSEQTGSQRSFRGGDQKNLSKGHRGNNLRGRGGKKRDLGRAEWSKQNQDKRQRNENEQAAKRQRIDRGEEALPIYATKFSEEDLKGEERRPKKKVAVLIGYAGTGYKGMQLTHDQKTIEGDLFQAFVAAGAISKVNADDPKKSSFVRCARTDKGVHAAGNVISLKLIIEDEDIVKRINDNLVPQIRVWGFERTNNSFSAYQMVDSRVYEYLIPTSSFLPPHPRSFLGRKCKEWAEKKGELAEWKERQEEVEGYWEKVDKDSIEPILQEYNGRIREILEKALYLREDGESTEKQKEEDLPLGKPVEELNSDVAAEAETGIGDEPNSSRVQKSMEDQPVAPTTIQDDNPTDKPTEPPKISDAIKRLRQAYINAKRSYRIPEKRLSRVQEALEIFIGTKNYHNYTIEKQFTDPSSKRVIKSFVVNPTPIVIDGTEWLSLKVHGQSFMMHQIRKMVGMVALVVRCGGAPEKIMTESFGPEKLSIPKAPSLGLLLERPVFDSYNRRARGELAKEAIDFDKFKTEMEEFKQREIYERMYRDEEKDNIFGNFFNHIDNFPEEAFLFVTSGGVEATRSHQENRLTSKKGKEQKGGSSKAENLVDVDSDDDDEIEKVDDKHGDEG